MFYCHAQLTTNALQLCRNIISWGKYVYLSDPNGIISRARNIQRKINNLLHGFEHIQVYLYDMLLTTKNNWDDHLVEIERVLLHLTEAGLKSVPKNRYPVATNVNTLDYGSHKIGSDH